MPSYRTLGGRVTARFVEKKSEFIATAAPVETEADAQAILDEIRAANRMAAHNVYAYLLREESRQRYSDDGEPAKTAGLPVLNVLLHAGVTDCIVVVTRYFGGTLLGTGGLVRAYTASAKAALEAADILTVRRCVRLTLTLPYPQYEPIARLLAMSGVRLSEPAFTDVVTLEGVLPSEDEESLAARLQEALRGEADAEWSPPFYLPF